MKNALLARLKRLEATVVPMSLPAYRIGVLKVLPADFTGDKHVVTTKQGPVVHNIQSCSFEERPGRPSRGGDDGIPRIYLTPDEANL